jgi:hypothetical protein
MDIGRPMRIIEIEPASLPVPVTVPLEPGPSPAPVEPPIGVPADPPV